MANVHNPFAPGLLRGPERPRREDVADQQPIAIPLQIGFNLNPMKIDYNGFRTDLSELTIYGLENLQMHLSASEADLSVTLVINAPLLQVGSGKYHLQGSVLFLSISDRGDFRADIHNLHATVVVRFDASGNNIVITQLDIDYTVGQVTAYLGGSRGVINRGFNDSLLRLLTTDRHIVLNGARRLITTLLNEIIREFTPAQLIELFRYI